jgi:hypothetical protein
MMNDRRHGRRLRRAVLAACALLSAGGHAMAAPAAVPEAPAQVPASACTLVSSDAHVDYGRFSPYDLPPSDPASSNLPLGKRIMVLRASCDAPRRMALFYRGEAHGADGFRFGPEGHLRVRILKAQLDGKPAALGQVKSAALQPAATAVAVSLTPALGALVMGAGRQLNLQVEIEALVPRTAMHPSNEQTWHSGGRFVLESMPAS